MTEQRPTTFSYAVALVLALGLAGCPYQPITGTPCTYNGANCFDEDRTFNFDDNRVDTMDLGALPVAPIVCREPARATVIRVIDGDTFDALVDGVDGNKPCGQVRLCERIRLIGIDTPETHPPDGSLPQCGGDEAATFTQNLIGHRVVLTFDQDCEDGTGPPPRSLAYAWFGPTRSDLWQTQLARRGFASLDTVEPNHNFAGEFAEDEQSAQSARRGIWAECRQVPAGL